MDALFSTFFFVILLRLHPTNSGVESEKNIFVLAGQGNMSGRGSMRLNETLAECSANPEILRFTANGTWEIARDPLHIDIDVTEKNNCGIGPGMPFSNAVLKKAPGFGVIGLVPCAIEGTAISQWAKGTPLYESMVARAAAALLNGGGVIRAILWYQGEADCGVEAGLYKARLQQFINDVRADLQSPFLPVIEVALNYNVSMDVIEVVRIAQLETADEVPNVKCVDARGLRLKDGDPVLLTTAAQVHLAGEMADAFLEISS